MRRGGGGGFAGRDTDAAQDEGGGLARNVHRRRLCRRGAENARDERMGDADDPERRRPRPTP